MTLKDDTSLVEQFREANGLYLSVDRVAKFFAYRPYELAANARVHKDTPTTRPHDPRLQNHMRELLRVLMVATELSGDASRAAFLIRSEPLRALASKTADELVQEGRADDVIAYLESLAAGAAG